MNDLPPPFRQPPPSPPSLHCIDKAATVNPLRAMNDLPPSFPTNHPLYTASTRLLQLTLCVQWMTSHLLSDNPAPPLHCIDKAATVNPLRGMNDLPPSFPTTSPLPSLYTTSTRLLQLTLCVQWMTFPPSFPTNHPLYTASTRLLQLTLCVQWMTFPPPFRQPPPLYTASTRLLQLTLCVEWMTFPLLSDNPPPPSLHCIDKAATVNPLRAMNDLPPPFRQPPPPPPLYTASTRLLQLTLCVQWMTSHLLSDNPPPPLYTASTRLLQLTLCVQWMTSHLLSDNLPSPPSTLHRQGCYS